ncbi:MAG: hypothetical protein ACOCXJ_02005 [Planctomycetota bacterium]
MAETFLERIRRWGRKREEHKSNRALEPRLDREQAGTDAAVQAASQTDRFQRRRSIDLFGLFRGPAEASRNSHRATGRFADPVLADLLLDHWADFFAHFREDERDFELARFEQEAEQVQQILDQLEPEERPDLVTCRQMLFLLNRLGRERFQTWDQRLDVLLAQNRDLEQQLNAIQLSTSWQTDEMTYCRGIITDAMKRRDSFVPAGSDGEPVLVSQLLCALLNITKAPPRPEASRGRRLTARADVQEPPPPAPDAQTDFEPVEQVDAQVATIQRTLRDLLRGQATRAKLNRVLGDRELAAELHSLVSSVRQYRTILAQLGLLSHAEGRRDGKTG